MKTDPNNDENMVGSRFLHRGHLGLALASLCLLLPFSVNNFLMGRVLLGVGALLIVALLVCNAWSIDYRGRPPPRLVSLSLVPVILLCLSVAIHDQGVIGVLWCYPAVLGLYFVLPERRAWAANLACLAVVLPLAWLRLEPSLAARVAATLLAVSGVSAIFIRAITVQQSRLHTRAITDPLTGALNRATLSETLADAARYGHRAGAPMSLLAFDLDHFKSVNDAYGHEAGDRALRGFCDLLRARCRSIDRVFRLGGEEFLMLLYGTDSAGARRVAEQLRAAVEVLEVLPGRWLTVSVGVATLAPGESWRDWMRRGDDRLYQAKLKGRNRVEWQGRSSPPGTPDP